MKLWLLKAQEDLPKGDNPWEPWFDKVFGFVIRAETEIEARIIAHENSGDENDDMFLDTRISNTIIPWLEAKYSTCDELQPEGECGVILSDGARAG